jgi:hypothetical protein
MEGEVTLVRQRQFCGGLAQKLQRRGDRVARTADSHVC